MEYEDQQTEQGPEDTLAAEGQALPADAATAGLQPETVNLAKSISEEDAQKYVDDVCETYERDWDSGAKHRKRIAKILRLALGDIPPPSDGEKFRLARIHYPIVMKPVLRMGARIYDQQIPSNGEYFGAKPTDATDLARSVRVPKHMNWQIAHKVPEYAPNHRVLINQMLLYGSAFSYVYWDDQKRGPCHEACRTEDIVLPYWRHSKDPSLSDVPQITRKLRFVRHELESKQDSGYYINVDKLYKKLEQTQGSATTGETSKTTGDINDVMDRFEGKEKPATDPSQPRLLLEQHRWLKLKGEERDRPVIVTVDYGTKTLLSLIIREDEDPEDRARFNREKQANEAMYEMAMQKFAMDMAQYNAGMMQPPPQDMTVPPMPGEQTMTAPPMPGMTSSTGPLVPPPTPPQPPAEPKSPRMVPINFFTHYTCFPNPEGLYGLGVGMLLEGANVAADTMGSQIIDTASLSNTPVGLRSRQAKVRGGEIRLTPGEFVETDLSPQDLAHGFFQLKFPGPEPALGQLIKDLKEEADALSGAGDILSGEVGGSNETATTTQIRISEAMQSITIIAKDYSLSRTAEAKKFARLNSVYLDDVEYFSVVDPFKQIPQEPEQISRMDYLEDTDITITADPRMASQPQRFQEALQAWNLVNSSPMLAQMPQLVMAVAKNLFIAMDRPDLLKGFEAGMAAQQQAAQMGAPPPGPPGAPPPQGPGPNTNGPPPSKGPPRPAPVGPRVPNTPAQPANSGVTQ